MTCCVACRASLNIFIRKKCASCAQAHCARCLTVVTPDRALLRSAVLMRGRNRRVCVKCAMLISGDYSRDDLAMRYSVRELRMFLVSCRVTISGCTEKDDLIELAMKSSQAPSMPHGEDHEHAIHVARLKEKMKNEMQSGAAAAVTVDTNNRSQHRVSSNAAAPSAAMGQTDAEQTAIYDDTEHTAIYDDAASLRSPSGGPAPTQQVPSDGANSQVPVHAGPSSNNDSPPSSTGDDRDQVSSTLPAASNLSSSSSASPFKQSGEHRRVKLADIADEASIELLTVRQLKELLANNFVDYKGCCERPELVARVRQLWNDNQRNVNYVESSSSTATVDGSSCGGGEFERNVCKICMDAVIDCLLLECGHMVTCTACGKRLAECPICRRYVVRVVHVFRA